MNIPISGVTNVKRTNNAAITQSTAIASFGYVQIITCYDKKLVEGLIFVFVHDIIDSITPMCENVLDGGICCEVLYYRRNAE